MVVYNFTAFLLDRLSFELELLINSWKVLRRFHSHIGRGFMETRRLSGLYLAQVIQLLLLTPALASFGKFFDY